jgi:hypothetical protein
MPYIIVDRTGNRKFTVYEKNFIFPGRLLGAALTTGGLGISQSRPTLVAPCTRPAAHRIRNRRSEMPSVPAAVGTLMSLFTLESRREIPLLSLPITLERHETKAHAVQLALS